jgi:D-apiose dehydrogenase
MLRGALVGCGYFGAIQLDGWSRVRGATIAALCDAGAERAAALAARWGIDACYTDIGELLEREALDFVDVATRPESHRALVVRAARRGSAVLCQKPLAPSLEEGAALVRECREAGARLMVNENWRWQPWYREMKRLLNAGAVGRPHYFGFRHRATDGMADPPYPNQPYFTTMPRLLLHETGVHFIDTACLLLGDPERIYCQHRRINPAIRGEDFVLVQLTMAGGAVVSLDASRCAAGDEGPVFGRAWLEGDHGQLALAADGRLVRFGPDGAAQPCDYAIPSTGYRGDSCRATQQHFIDCLESGAPFETEGADYLRTFAAVFAGYESAERGQAVDIAEFMARHSLYGEFES